MLSAFKRLVNNNNTNGNQNEKINLDTNDRIRISGMQPMNVSLQKKFSKGVQYNMKIIIRGDRNVGKTCLLLRLQGEQFREEYIPTDEIQVANIRWSYNATDDIVKVEVWDVVDKAKKKKQINELKLNEINSKNKNFSEEIDNTPALDAEFIDVYKNTNGVILVFDITKSWSFDYIVKEMENIPRAIPIIILGNHRDMGHHRVVSIEKVKSYIESVKRECSGQLRYIETSMRNGFGLKFLYKFFNLPFLHLQRQTLLKQLETNTREFEASCQELLLLEESDEQNYERFLYIIQNKRRELADKLSQTPNLNSNNSLNHLKNKSNLTNISNNNIITNEIVKPSPSIIIGANNPLPQIKNFNKLDKKFEKDEIKNKDLKQDLKLKEFENDDQIKLKNFLEDAIEKRNENQDVNLNLFETESDSESEKNAPIILSYQDDLDPEDICEGQPSLILENIKEKETQKDETFVVDDDENQNSKSKQNKYNNIKFKTDKKKKKKKSRLQHSLSNNITTKQLLGIQTANTFEINEHINSDEYDEI